MSTEEDKRNAVQISITLSSQLVTAALAMLTVEGAYVAYVLDKRVPEDYFGLVSMLSAIFFILSVFIAGKAITAARNAGFDGNWNLESGKGQFNLQALFNALGLFLLVGVVLLSGTSKREDTIAKNITSSMHSLETVLQSGFDASVRLHQNCSDLKTELNQLQVKIEAANQEIRYLKENPNKPINADKKLRCAPFFPGYR